MHTQNKNNYGMNLYQEYIHKSRYARFLEDEGRRENWDETVARYFDFFEEHLKENNNFDLKPYRKELEIAVLNQRVMPSMRALMTAGPALKRENVAGYNCLAGDTKILTKEYGLTEISSLEGKKVSVLNSDGEWSETIVNNYGEQSLSKINFRFGASNQLQEVFATDNHDWVLSDGRRIQTSELKKGMEIPLVMRKRLENYEGEDYRLGIIHGLIYGDGTQVRLKTTPQDKIIRSQERDKGYHIRLCSDQKDLLKYFDGYPISYPETFGGDPIVYLYDNFAKTHELKKLPSKDETEAYLVGFFRGWLAADGYISATGQASICVDIDEENWLRNIMPVFGIHFDSSYELSKETNFGSRNKSSRILGIWRASLTKFDFLIERKKERFKELIAKIKISNVIKSNRVENVYCVSVPDYRNFVIEKGILTGNCSFVAINRMQAFDEILYVLMNGTGVGFSVETDYVEQLPRVAESFHDTDTTIQVADSKMGWARSLRELIGMLYVGQIPKWDTSKVRPAGALLKTFGGRASGPEPLEDLFRFCVSTFQKAAGRRLTSLECHDIVCKIGEAVVVGGVRRSATISLSDLSDDRLRTAKSGQWWLEHPERSLANNSAVYKEKPEIGLFMQEWLSLYESKSGERGIFNRHAAVETMKKTGRRDSDHIFGTNPCGEILLRDREFCNLTEKVIRETETMEDLERDIVLATILGTIQSTLTNFKYLSSAWKKNCEEERLLGVSLTGIMCNELTNGRKTGLEDRLSRLRDIAIETNKKWASMLGINPSVAVTCVKPSGTVSQLVMTPSGIHPDHSEFYIRTVRADKKDPLAQLLIDSGVPYEDDVMRPDSVYVFSFPIRKSKSSIFRKDMGAIEHLETWLKYKEAWCEHNPSITVSVRENEWLEVGAWVYKNFDKVCGISFLPYSEHVYRQAPYQDCTEQEYLDLVEKMPKDFDWDLLKTYETTDMTEGTREFACVSGNCEI